MQSIPNSRSDILFSSTHAGKGGFDLSGLFSPVKSIFSAKASALRGLKSGLTSGLKSGMRGLNKGFKNLGNIGSKFRKNLKSSFSKPGKGGGGGSSYGAPSYGAPSKPSYNG